MPSVRFALLCLCAVLVACGQDETAPLPGPTSRELLFGVSLPGHLRLSPDGQWASFSQAYRGVRNIWLKPALSDADARPLTTFGYPGVGPHVWHPSGEYLLFLRQTPQSDDVRPYVYDLKRQESRALLGGVGQQASFVSFSKQEPFSIFVQTNNRQAGERDIYKVDLESGAALLVYQDDLGASGYIAGPDLRPLIAQIPRSDGGFDWRIRTDGGAWRLWGQVSPQDALTTRLEAVSNDGLSVFAKSTVDRNTAAYIQFSAEGRFELNQAQILAAQDDYDFADATYSPLTHTPFLATFATPRPSFVPLDDRLVPLVFGMRGSDSGSLLVVDTGANAQRWLIGHVTASQPTKWGVFDSELSRKIPLFPAQDALMEAQAAILPDTVAFSGPDGQLVNGFLSLPLGTARSSDGRLEKPLPVAIVLRGALASRDRWTYSPLHQWLASRGVAVLSLNHRGSVGQGKAHLYPANGLTTAIATDVRAAMSWLKERQIAGERVAILASGASTQAALQLADGETVSCLSLVRPVLSLGRALGSMAPQQSALAGLLKASFSGDEATPFPRQPTFIAAAGAYRRERIDAVFEWSAAAQEAGTPLTLVASARADTRFDQGADARAVMATMELFLADCLNFTPEAMSYSDFKEASIDVIEASDALALKVAEARREPVLPPD